jgi:flagellar biosynthetic protein FliR
MLEDILANAPVFLLLAARALAMIEVAPIISSDAVPQAAKIALAGFAAFAAFPEGAAKEEWAALQGMAASPFGLGFLLLLLGEAVIGIILGFFLTIIFAAFSTAGQFFSLQMGFGITETFDPLSQVENPLMGQFLNLVAMLVFLVIGGFSRLFLEGFWQSVKSINIVELIAGREYIVTMMITGLSRLFVNAMMISMPILGSLFLCSLATGLISRAAPQINILSEGFPISIAVAFILIRASFPFMVEAFANIMGAFFVSVGEMMRALSPD